MRTLALIVVMFLSGRIYGQTMVFSSGDAGYFLHHSDNQLPITENEDLRYLYGGTVGIETPLLNDYTIRIEASFFRADVTKLFNNLFVGNPPSFSITTRSATLIQRTVPIDFSISPRSESGLSYAAGISLTYTNRRTEVPYLYSGDPFIDAFNSFGVGVNGSIRSMFAIDEGGRLWLYGAVKFRYIHTVVFESNGRDLSGYTLDYLHGQLSAGLAWSLL